MRVAEYLLVLAIATLAPMPSSDKGSMPQTLKSPYSEYASWVDARALSRKGGTIYAPAIHPSAAARVEWLLKQEPSNGCIQAPQDEANRVSAEPRSSLREAITSAEFILLGHVTGRSFGFFGMHAGQILRISVDRVFKGSGDSPEYFAFIPSGSFEVLSKKVCARDNSYAPPPEIGSELFVFTYPPDGEILNIANAGDLVPVSASGELTLPMQYAAEHVFGVNHAERKMTRDDLSSQIGAVLTGVAK